MAHRPAGPLSDPYMGLKKAAKNDMGGSTTSTKLLEVIGISLDFLNNECIPVELISMVPGKTYFSYALKSHKKLLSRPINKDLFSKKETVFKNWSALEKGRCNKKLIEPLAYTMAIAYCAASDLFDRGNKKGPATYFECLIGHLFARELGINPSKKVTLPTMGHGVRMTMDFIFDLGAGKPKVHLPVKMSTRERVVQAWSHQRILDSAFGHAAYRGILVIHSETKLDLKERQVVEICVPDQWLAYQTHLATMDRIYYFDMPDRYAQIADKLPFKNFSEVFIEKEEVLSAPMA